MIKKVLIYSNNKPQSLDLKAELIDKLKQTDIQVVDKDIAPDFIISIGGDGTLLSAFHEFNHHINSSRFIGIHTGHLGFYTDWQSFDIRHIGSTHTRDCHGCGCSVCGVGRRYVCASGPTCSKLVVTRIESGHQCIDRRDW